LSCFHGFVDLPAISPCAGPSGVNSVVIAFRSLENSPFLFSPHSDIILHSWRRHSISTLSLSVSRLRLSAHGLPWIPSISLFSNPCTIQSNQNCICLHLPHPLAHPTARRIVSSSRLQRRSPLTESKWQQCWMRGNNSGERG
jgi:hypothetical protein